MTGTLTVQDHARDIVSQMAANGATFDFHPAVGALPASFVYSMPRGGDRWKCRSLIASAKADPLVWRALVAEIETRCGGAND